MIYLNRIEVIGNLTRDPELRFTPTNQAVTTFSLATNRRYRDPNGTWVESPPEYHEVVVWGQLAERCNQVLHKGDRIYVTGRLQTRSWEAQDGSKRYKTELIADSLIGPDQINKSTGGPGGTSNEGGSYNNAPSYSQDEPSSESTPKKSPAPKPSAPGPEEEINIDDIPF
jgi:single-strand DNA-binding protein